MASTPAGGVVMFGGERVTQPGTSLSDTHRLATGNQSWSRSANAPVARSGHSMAGIMVGGSPRYYVFGGLTDTGQPSADTWQYDGSGWDPRGQGSGTPTARSAHGMVAGLLGGAFGGNPRMWLFGGFNGTVELSDMWSYQPDVDQWNSLGSATGQPVGSWPPARSAHCLAFQQGANTGDERVYLFGGRTGSAGFTNELWRFNPNTSTWQLLTPSNPPPARREAAMAYLPGAGGLVLFGGFGASSSALADTWIYDPTGNAWTQRVTALAPPGRSGHAVTVDVTGNKLILLGGVDATGKPATGTWLWDSAAPGSPPGAWVEQLPVPTPRTGAAMAFDGNAARRRHVLFGGAASPSGTVLDETWELDGIDFTQRVLTAKPSARTDAGMVYHAARDRVVLFGGRNQVGASLGDTWEWNGSTWGLYTGANPPAAGGAQPVYDTTRSRIVMPLASGGVMQTWVLGSSTWTQLATVVSPPERTNHGAAFDTRRDQVVMFGGMSSNVRGSAIYNNETWIFDGTTWVRRFPVSSPSPRGWCRLSYDESRSRVVLYGGADATNVWQDTWEWDGSNWVQEIPQSAPSTSSANFGTASSYDSKRALVVTHGVIGTWDYGPVAPADVTSYGAGCTTSANATLNLKQLGWSRLWLGDHLELDIEGAPAFSLGLMLWGLSNTTFGPGVPLPLDLRLVGFSTGPCYLSTSADITSEAVFPPTTRYTSFAMPVDPFLLGLELYLQMAYFDAPANPSNPPAVTSNALKMKLGQKASLLAAPFEPNQALGMVRIGAGSFVMGSGAGDANEVPTRTVSITQPLWVGKFEVTQSLYSAVVGINPSSFQGPSYPNSGGRPVELVTWHDAMRFCAILDAQEVAAGRVPIGYQYRLPTEAEWEYFCRAGTSTEWNTGASLTAAQFGNPSGQSANAGQFAPNGFGLHDLHGNVWEWCLDGWDGNANYATAPVADPHLRSGRFRVIRGGSWYDPASETRSSRRRSLFPEQKFFTVGLRIVLAPKLVFYPPQNLDLVAIAPGSFAMGSVAGNSNEAPVHTVTLTQPFWMGRFEVTQADYVARMGVNPSRYQPPVFPDSALRPVEEVNRASATAFCDALTAEASATGQLPPGYEYRLPTEAEWEYCCRAGTTTEWSTGASLGIGDARFGVVVTSPTTVVGSYPANSFGLCDMHGNAWEWCLDSWNSTANYPSGPVTDPYGATGSAGVVRGGSWGDPADFCRSAFRFGVPPTGSSGLGFRIVLAPVIS